jgi:hypothetical protein
MNLYIETENGVTKNHPALEENLIEAFGSVPSNWEAFVRVERPTNLGVYQIVNDPIYAKVEGVWTDVWTIRDMTAEEKTATQQTVKDAFANRPQAENWSAWFLDETTCLMQPPIPRPEFDQAKISSGIFLYWCGAENNWKETPIYPVDDNQYKFDFFTWQWVQL